jgi:hypothetical protein
MFFEIAVPPHYTLFLVVGVGDYFHLDAMFTSLVDFGLRHDVVR